MFYSDSINGLALQPTLINSYSTLTIPAYWRALNFLANNLASFPRSVRQNGAPLASKHPMDRLLGRRPNTYQDGTTFWRTLFLHFLHAGNGYARVERGSLFSATALHNMLPEDVAPFRYIDDEGGVTQFYAHRPTKKIYPAADVVHLTGLAWDGMCGIDPVMLHAATFQRAATIDRHFTRYLLKGTVLRGSVEVPEGASEEQVDDIVLKLKTFYQGAEAERDVIVLSGGAKLNNATLTPQQSQLSEQSTVTTKQIAQITGVHPHFLFDDSEGKYNNNVEQSGQDVVRYTFRTLIEQVEDQLTIKLVEDAEQDDGLSIFINPDALTRGDSQTITDTVVAQKQAGLVSINEGRERLGYPKDADAESDKLKTAGDTTPTPPGETTTPPDALAKAQPVAQNYSQKTSAEWLAALTPVVAEACQRVDRKTEKAFDNHKGKSGAELTVWGNVFSSQQAKYAIEVLSPILSVFGRSQQEIDRIGEAYGSSIRGRVAGNEFKSLQAILDEK